MSQALETLLPDKRALDVTIAEGKEPLRTHYSMFCVTQESLDRIGDAGTDDFELMCGWLEMVGLEWDLTLGGEPLPPTTEGFRKAPRALPAILFDAIVQDCRPKEPTNATSSDGSNPEESSSTAQSEPQAGTST